MYIYAPGSWLLALGSNITLRIEHWYFTIYNIYKTHTNHKSQVMYIKSFFFFSNTLLNITALYVYNGVGLFGLFPDSTFYLAPFPLPFFFCPCPPFFFFFLNLEMSSDVDASAPFHPLDVFFDLLPLVERSPPIFCLFAERPTVALRFLSVLPLLWHLSTLTGRLANCDPFNAIASET